MGKIAEFLVRAVARFAMRLGVNGEQIKIWVNEECINEVDHLRPWRTN